MQQVLRVNFYRSWQAEVLQEHAERCIQLDLQKKIMVFCRGVVFLAINSKIFYLVTVPNSAQMLGVY